MRRRRPSDQVLLTPEIEIQNSIELQPAHSESGLFKNLSRRSIGWILAQSQLAFKSIPFSLAKQPAGLAKRQYLVSVPKVTESCKHWQCRALHRTGSFIFAISIVLQIHSSAALKIVQAHQR